jgi:hypothetical protein
MEICPDNMIFSGWKAEYQVNPMSVQAARQKPWGASIMPPR